MVIDMLYQLGHPIPSIAFAIASRVMKEHIFILKVVCGHEMINQFIGPTPARHLCVWSAKALYRASLLLWYLLACRSANRLIKDPEPRQGFGQRYWSARQRLFRENPLISVCHADRNSCRFFPRARG